MDPALMIEFAWPYAFLLIPLPWIIYKLLPPSTFNKQAALRVPDLHDFHHFQQRSFLSSPKFKTLFVFLIWLALLTSAARPQWIGNMVEIPQSGRDLMLAVDLSGSMQIKDFEINDQHTDRLTALKLIVSDFIDRRKGDRIGLILFGSQAYLQTPLTFDIATVKQLLMESSVGLAGNETAIGDAIGLAVKQLRDTPQESRVLILITDGNHNTGELLPEKAAEIAAHEKLKIHSIAIGAKQMVVQTFFGPKQIANSDIDEKTLQMVAEKTGGQYFRAYNTSELVKIYQFIDQLESIKQTSQFYRPTDEIYHWPLGLAMIGFGLLMCNEWFRRRQQ